MMMRIREEDGSNFSRGHRGVAVLLQHLDHLVLACLVRAKFRALETEGMTTAEATKKLANMAVERRLKALGPCWPARMMSC